MIRCGGCGYMSGTLRANAEGNPEPVVLTMTNERGRRSYLCFDCLAEEAARGDELHEKASVVEETK